MEMHSLELQGSYPPQMGDKNGEEKTAPPPLRYIPHDLSEGHLSTGY